MRFRLGELYAGPGGLGLGASLAHIEQDGITYSIKHTWANDYDKDSCDTYRTNLCPKSSKSVIHKDIRKLSIEKLPYIDALAFGFPCNDFSIVGEQKGMDGIYGPLYSYGIRALTHFQPSWFIAENVSGLRNSNEGNAFEEILNEMFLAGYNLTPHIYKFEQYGVPQNRHRIIIVGIRKDIGLRFNVPAPTHIIPISAKDAIENPPILNSAHNNEHTRHADHVIQRLHYIKPGENAFTADLPPHLTLQVSGATISQIYRRLHPDKPSYTVTGSGGGGTHVYHWEENRALTNRERARLQTFPDNFIFCGSKESVRKQIGMAVPPRAAQVIFEAILKTFAHVDYQSVDANFSCRFHTEETNKYSPIEKQVGSYYQMRMLESDNIYSAERNKK